MEALQQFGISLIQALQTLSPAFDGIMKFFTFLGRIEFYLLLIPFIYWTIDKRLGMRTLLVLIFIDTAGMAFKLLFHQTRPYWIGGVKPLAEETSYGIPSTHASDSLAVGGYLAYRVKRTWFWIVLVILLFFIGLSRLFLGAHFPHDVLFGWLIGAIVLWGFMRSIDRIATWAKSKTLSTQIAVGFGISIAIILIGLLLRLLISGTSDPASWSDYAIEARTISPFFTLSGALFGSIVGYALMRQYARFQTSGTWSTRVLRYLLGIIGVILICFGLDVAFGLITPDETALGYALRYIRYAAATFWMTWGAPSLFLKIKLAEAENYSGAARSGPAESQST
jgi:membrane-associated phospholipid phosphatase